MNAHGAFGFGIRDDVVIFTGARTFFHDADGVIQGGGVFHDFADEFSHGLAFPATFTAAAHFANGNLFAIHGGDGADETGIGDVYPGIGLFGLGDDHDSAGFEADAPH